MTTGNEPPQPADVSVVMPAYNAAATIGTALQSIARQSLRPREVIVVDDGSTDSTLATASACRGKMGHVHLRVFTQARSGAGAARNQAIAQATSISLRAERSCQSQDWRQALRWRFEWRSSMNHPMVKIVADFDREIIESNEINNTLVLMFTAPPSCTPTGTITP